MANDVLFALILLVIIAGVSLYLVVTQKRGFQQLHSEFEKLNNNIVELIEHVPKSSDEKNDVKEEIAISSSKKLDNHRIKVLETNDFDFKIRAHNKGKLKIKTSDEDIDFEEKNVFNHFSNNLTERNKEIEVVRKLK